MWPDNETVIDLLGFDVHRDLLAGLAANRNLLPVTVGLFGDWGGGKSSVMRMLKDRLDAEDGVACLYFNGWTFEGYDDAKTALIASILIELAEHERIGPKIRGKVVGLLKRVNYLRMASVIFKHGPQALSGAVGLAAMTGFIDPHMAAAMAAGTAGLSHVGAGLTGASRAESGGSPEEGAELELGALRRKDQTQPAPLDIRTFRRDFEQLIAETDLKALVVLIETWTAARRNG